MLKKMTISVVAIMLAASTAQAFNPPGWGSEGFNIQSQDLAASLESLIDFAQSEQHADNHQWVDVYNKHNLDNAHNIDAWQEQKYFLSEVGKADGDSADLDLAQAIDGVGSQLQLVKGGTGSKAQWQAQALGGAQLLTKVGGEAHAVGSHTALLNESQGAENSAGSMYEASNIIGSQTLTYSGGPTAVGAVGGTMNVATQQSQVVVN